MGLRTVFYNSYVLPRATSHDGREIDRLAINMHRDHSPDRRQTFRRGLQHCGEFIGIHCEMLWLDIEKHRRRADHLNGGNSGDCCM